MRKFVKTVAVLALAVSVLSTSAFAADLGGTLSGANGTYSLNVTGAAADEQVTLLAVNQDAVEESEGEYVLKASVADEDIFYIDQVAGGNFGDFQVKDNFAGNELFFFAGSATTTEAKLIDRAENLVITIGTEGNVTEVEVNEELQFTATFLGGSPEAATWSVTSDNDANVTFTDDSIAGATFKASEAGDYTVKVTMNGVDSNTVTIKVNAEDYNAGASSFVLHPTTPDGETTEAQYGLGVALTVTPELAFDKMIWVLVDGEGERYYSKPCAISGIGAGTETVLYAAFANGNGDTTEKIDVVSVDAIFAEDVAVAGTEVSYFTNPEADNVPERME